MLTFKWKETCDCIFLIQISIKHWKRWNQLYKSVNINIMCKVSFFENLMFEDIGVQSRITQILSQKKRKYNSFAIFVDFKYWDTKYKENLIFLKTIEEHLCVFIYFPSKNSKH